jgi:transposase
MKKTNCKEIQSNQGSKTLGSIEKWVGVDTHKDTLACYCGNSFKEFRTTPSGFKKALEWAPNANWAIEGAYCFGKPFASFLTKSGCRVYEINPFITKSWRAALSANGNKNDYGDAKVISIFSKNLTLDPVSFKTIELKEKITARNLLIKQRTTSINAVKMLYFTRGEDLPFKDFTTRKAMIFLNRSNDLIVKSHAEILLKTTELIKKMETEIKENTPEKALKLTGLTGISELTAAMIWTETKGKLTTKAAFASYCGVAPVENSSGKTLRHKSNKRGNRVLNSIFWRTSIHQARFDEKGKAYFEKKLQEGKSPRHARKCLARQLINITFNILNC